MIRGRLEEEARKIERELDAVPREPAQGSAAPRALYDDETDAIPAMPVRPRENTHRQRVPELECPFSALVARPVSKNEARANPKAQAALLKEWDQLRKAGCWDESKVQEWGDVAGQARRAGTNAHVGRIFEICVEKGSELAPNDPARKFKGRVVFQGNQVLDERWDVALFQELGSSPATMEAGKACDAFGLLPGHMVQQADAEQAYIQSKLGGPTTTWIRMPPERRPASWAKYRDPVCPLVKALCGKSRRYNQIVGLLLW